MIDGLSRFTHSVTNLTGNVFRETSTFYLFSLTLSNNSYNGRRRNQYSVTEGWSGVGERSRLSSAHNLLALTTVRWYRHHSGAHTSANVQMQTGNLVVPALDTSLYHLLRNNTQCQQEQMVITEKNQRGKSHNGVHTEYN